MGNRTAYRVMALVFAGATALGVYGFVHGLTQHRVRTAWPPVIVTIGACAYGLWTMSSWGRNLSIVVGIANAGLGMLTLLASLAEKTSVIAPAILLAISVAIVIALTRSWYALPEDPK